MQAGYDFMEPLTADEEEEPATYKEQEEQRRRTQGSDQHLVNLIETRIRSKVIDVIYGTFPLPVGYLQWRDQIIGVDAQLSRRREAKKHNDRRMQSTNSRFIPQRQPTTTSSNRGNFPPIPSPIPTQRTATGITYRGAGQPMSIDEMRKKGLCFKCHQQGHLSRNCPNTIGGRQAHARIIQSHQPQFAPPTPVTPPVGTAVAFSNAEEFAMNLTAD